MITIEQSITINLPVERVFELYADARNHPRWDPTIVEVRQDPDGPLGLGTRVMETRKLLGRTISNTREVIQYKTNASISFQAGGPIPGKGSITFEENGSGTLLTQQMQMDVAGFFKLAEPLVTASFRRTLRNTLNDFKLLIESEHDLEVSVSK